ncbi:putative short chain type dehydrogenase [Lindgomyces ingoldianus]|uniref:Short chain type dehydrogenase n=1 Tax=Lindgomyces ingoldianus TaxID=673940 RepID=A0ACB6R1H4_9PLEO|nr:putative short chain type dehydrogenase [Lindgomyces ingoldianus]KAF2472935.1 putative short chain type dehydrogenase [Lindgomyces ingoldianus]
MSRLQSKTAIITGSSSGLGRAIALLFARHGANIVCSDLREQPRGEMPEASSLTTMEELSKMGARAIFITCDTSNANEVQELVGRTVREFGRLDIIVNNAGIALEPQNPSPVWDYPEDWFDKTLAVNLKGVFLGCKYASKQMMGQDPGPNGDRGWIINLASVLGLGGTPKSAGYTSSKHGVMGLTKSAAWDCAPHRIHVNAICPGYTASSMTKTIFDQPDVKSQIEAMHPFRGLGEPEDIARAALFLASEDSSWITGIGLPVDGGYGSM